MGDEANLSGWSQEPFDDGRWTRPVYRRGKGPAVIVMHEIPGLHPEVERFGRRVADAGMTVLMPSLFGRPGKPVTRGYAAVQMLKSFCVRREFTVWATGRSSPIVDWLRALARKAHDECGGPGVGAVGMCFTGGFALAMMTEPAVVAPVLSQPSLPAAMGPGSKKRRGRIDSSPQEIACARSRLEDEDLTLLGLRFHGDPFVPEERFAMLKDTFGERFEAIELDPEDARPFLGQPPHSVLTLNLRDDDPDGPTKKAEQRVIAFFRERLGVG